MLKLDPLINMASKRIITVVTRQLLLRRHVNMADKNRTFPTEKKHEFRLFKPNFISLQLRIYNCF